MHNSFPFFVIVALSTFLPFAAALVVSTSTVLQTAPPTSPTSPITSFTPTDIVEPTATTTPDPWQCATRNVTQYFDVPRPSGNLEIGMNSYVSMLVKPCLATATGWDRVSCSVSETSKFCEFSTHSSVRPAIQTSYVAYASAAAAWYSAKSADIANMKEDCPVTWDNVDEVKQAWFNHTIIQGNCYNQAHNNVTGDGIGSGDGIN